MPVTINGTAGVTFNNSSVSSVGGVGDGQTWQNVSGSRAIGTTYTNSTGKPIQVLFCGGVNATYTSFVNGVQISSVVQANQTGTHAFIVPNGQTYQINNGTVNVWAELR